MSPDDFRPAPGHPMVAAAGRDDALLATLLAASPDTPYGWTMYGIAAALRLDYQHTYVWVKRMQRRGLAVLVGTLRTSGKTTRRRVYRLTADPRQKGGATDPSRPT